MRDLKIEFIWKRQRAKDCYIPFHAHKYYELVYYPYGSGVTNLGEHAYHFGPNTFAIITPDTEHDELHLTNSEVICLGFSCAHELPELFCRDDSMKIQTIVKEILKESSNQAFDYQNMMIAKMNELYIQLLRLQRPKSAAPKNFEHIINYINENFHEKIQLTTFAKQLNISYDYFQHKFKSLTGYSPQQFLLNRRLDAAKELLSSGNLSCTEIAYRCGFSTPAQFSMLFKQKHGYSPLSFKKGQG